MRVDYAHAEILTCDFRLAKNNINMNILYQIVSSECCFDI